MVRSNWLEKQVTLYLCHSDITGKPVTYRHILFSSFGIPHKAFYKEYNPDRWITVSEVCDINTICKLRGLNSDSETYAVEKSNLKKVLSGYTPAALLKTRKKNHVEVIERTGLMQLDFDEKDIKQYELEDLKQAVFDNLPFVAFCGLSCSGKGFYALVLIAEPERLDEYAEHFFETFKKEFGVKLDEGKGGNVGDLRYTSYDANPLYRENPEPLKIKHFRRKEAFKPVYLYKSSNYKIKDGLVKKLLQEVQSLQVGQRWENIQRISFTLGGLGKPEILNEINQVINSNPSFTGEEKKYTDCAQTCFNAGLQKLLTT